MTPREVLQRLVDACEGWNEQPTTLAESRWVHAEYVNSYGAARAYLAQPEAEAAPSSVRKLIDEQAEDDGLWFEAETAPEAYLQAALRKLHAAVEGSPSPAQPEPQDEARDAARLDFVQSQIGTGKWGCYYVIQRLDSGEFYFRPASNLHGPWWANCEKPDERNGPFHTIRDAIDSAMKETAK